MKVSKDAVFWTIARRFYLLREFFWDIIVLSDRRATFKAEYKPTIFFQNP